MCLRPFSCRITDVFMFVCVFLCICMNACVLYKWCCIKLYKLHDTLYIWLKIFNAIFFSEYCVMSFVIQAMFTQQQTRVVSPVFSHLYNNTFRYVRDWHPHSITKLSNKFSGLIAAFIHTVNTDSMCVCMYCMYVCLCMSVACSGVLKWGGKSSHFFKCFLFI